MKVIGINGSQRKDSNTAIIINTCFEELEKEDIETELIQLANSIIEPCRACMACNGKNNCVFRNDIFAETYEKLAVADGIILGSPVYAANVPSNMQAFLERMGVVSAVNPNVFRHKVGASVSSVRRAGGMQAVDIMNHFFLYREMFVVGSTYWNMAYGANTGDVSEDAEGIANMRNIGQNMAFLLKKLHL